MLDLQRLTSVVFSTYFLGTGKPLTNSRIKPTLVSIYPSVTRQFTGYLQETTYLNARNSGREYAGMWAGRSTKGWNLEHLIADSKLDSKGVSERDILTIFR